MKKQEEIFKRDLSKVDGTYTKLLTDNYVLITDLGNDVRIDLPNYIKRISSIVEPATDTPAKRNFLMKLHQKRSKFEAMLYVSNAWLNGSGLGTI